MTRLHRPGRLTRLALIAAAMSGFLVFMLASHAIARAEGREIMVEVEGYDPRDIFLGHYAQIRTPLNALDPARLDGDDDFTRHAAIFVSLEIGEDGLARPVALHRQHPGHGLVAEGRIRSIGETIRAVFNIERYYASRDDALALQARLRAGGDNPPVRLILAVPESGHLLIKGFEIDGERRIDRTW